jgi:hypothetical protein
MRAFMDIEKLRIHSLEIHLTKTIKGGFNQETNNNWKKTQK